MKPSIWTSRHATYSNSKNQNFNSKGSGNDKSFATLYVLDVCITAFWCGKISLHSNSLVNMADNVNDKGDSRTIQEIVRAVVANLRVVFRKIRTSAWQYLVDLADFWHVVLEWFPKYWMHILISQINQVTCQAEVRILQKTTLKFATTALTISWIVLESPLSFTLSAREFEWREIFSGQNAVMQTSHT